MTDATSAINTALAELQTQLPRIAKDQTAKVPIKTGGSYQYSYADLAQVSREVLPLLGKLGLSFTSRPTLHDGRFVLAYELRHTSGESVSGAYPLPTSGSPQEIGGAITYARRYCLCAVTGVAPDDDDNDAAAAAAATNRRQRRETKPTQEPGGDSPMDSGRQRRMQTAFQSLGLTDRAEKLRYAVGVVKRPLNSATELTQQEAEKVISAAEREIAQKAAGEPSDWPATAQPGGAA